MVEDNGFDLWEMPGLLQKMADRLAILEKIANKWKMEAAANGFKTLGAVRDHSGYLLPKAVAIVIKHHRPKSHALSIAQVVHGWAVGSSDKATGGWGAAAFKHL